jgi:hypothetical protein
MVVAQGPSCGGVTDRRDSTGRLPKWQADAVKVRSALLDALSHTLVHWLCIHNDYIGYFTGQQSNHTSLANVNLAMVHVTVPTTSYP